MTKPETLSILETLIGFDTTSRNSNLELMAWIEGYLRDLGVEPILVHNEEGTKANLYATLGPTDRPGVMLSGHTDVVPIDGQDWSTDPFELLDQGDRLLGRGTCDMKGFIAVCLAYAPAFQKNARTMPIHFAFSYDEEVGCIGVHRLIEKLQGMPIRPAMCVVGEPSSMQVVTGHKGKRSYRATFTGTEAHSSLAPLAVNAVEQAARFVCRLREIAERFRREGPFDEMFDVPYTTVHTGVMSGGAALNIVPQSCEIEFEFRNLSGHDGDAIIAEIEAYAREHLEPEMKAIAEHTGVEIIEENNAPGLDTGADEDVVTFVKSLAGRNDHTKVAYATEAGLFQHRLDIPTVVCGPGSIEQAHKPNEFITHAQLELCELFMDRLLERLN